MTFGVEYFSYNFDEGHCSLFMNFGGGGRNGMKCKCFIFCQRFLNRVILIYFIL